MLVTGASGGIGSACVRAFGAEGARVLVHYHRGEERARSLAEELGGAPVALKNEITRIAPRGRVNAVAPGWTESPMTRGLVDEDQVRAVSRTMALRKVAHPRMPLHSSSYSRPTPSPPRHRPARRRCRRHGRPYCPPRPGAGMSESPGRKSVNAHTTPFLPYDMEGPVQPEMSWLPLSYDDQTGQGTYLMRMEPGAVTIAHDHAGMEEFLILEGNLVDSDGTIFGPGDFVSYDAGTHHNSWTETGCLIAVFEWQRPAGGANGQ